ncbi:unnamed protein product [Musa textilis]
MPHKFYHGRTGKVWNVTKRAIGVEINKQVRGMCVFVSVPNTIAKVWAKHSGNKYYVVNTMVWKTDLRNQGPSHQVKLLVMVSSCSRESHYGSIKLPIPTVNFMRFGIMPINWLNKFLFFRLVTGSSRKGSMSVWSMCNLQGARKISVQG